jgi:hypothetical protein
VQPALTVHERRQRVDVGRLQLRHLAVLEDQVDHLVPLAAAPPGPMHPSSGSFASASSTELELVEEDRLELAGRADVELVADEPVDPGLEPGQGRGELLAHRLERLEVDSNAGQLHPGKDRQERHLDLVEQVGEAALGELPLEGRDHEHRRHGFGRRPSGHRVFLGAGVGTERPIGQRRTEARRGHVVDRLRAERGVDHVTGDERVEEAAPELDATVRRQRDHQLLQVVADATRLGLGEPRGQPLDRDARRVARHVPARAIRAGERDPEQAASDRPAAAHRPSKADGVAVRLEPRRQLVHLLGRANDARIHVLDRPGRIRQRVGPRSWLRGGIRGGALPPSRSRLSWSPPFVSCPASRSRSGRCSTPAAGR